MSKDQIALSEIECGPGEIAGFLKLTDRRIRQLAKEEIIPQRKRGIFNLQDVTQSYIDFLRQGAPSSRGGTADNPVDYNVEKALLTKAQREKAELEVAVLRGELHRGEDVKAVMSDMITACRAKLMSMPTKIAPRLLAQSEMAVVQDIVKHGVYEALQELAEYDPGKFNQRNKKVVQNANTDDS